MDDKFFLDLAFKEAKNGYGRVSPNPMVGAVVVRENKVIASGYHKSFGGEHAEVIAMKGVSSEELKSSTLYVTLEPCCIEGKTPACTDFILKSGVRRVVISEIDPNPLVSGKSVELLRSKGVDVKVIPCSKIRFLNRKFNKFISTGIPYFTLKIASTLDGYIADSIGGSKYITGPDCRSYVHKMRAGNDAILIGANTLRVDNPNLGLHEFGSEALNDPVRIVMSSANFNENAYDFFRDRNFKVCHSYIELFEYCNEYRISSLMIEGGSSLFTYFIKEDLVDELVIMYGSKLLGDDNLSFVNSLGINKLSDCKKFRLINLKRFKNDFMVRYVNY